MIFCPQILLYKISDFLTTYFSLTLFLNIFSYCFTICFPNTTNKITITLVMDRDLNASKNILRIGMDSLRNRDIPIEAPTPLG